MQPDAERAGSGLYVPGMHGRHEETLVPMTGGGSMKVPLGQGRGCIVPAGQKWPDGQPAVHSGSVRLFVAPYVPEGQRYLQPTNSDGGMEKGVGVMYWPRSH